MNTKQSSTVQPNDSRAQVLSVYAAAPLTLRRDPELHGRRLQQIRSHYPDARIVDALEEFDGLRDWQTRWPTLVRRIDTLVFMADKEGTIGAGTVKELMDAIVHRVPVQHVTGAGLLPFSAVHLLGLAAPSAWRAMRVEVTD